MKSSNYRDYVIKNGKFIGDFENMYQNSEVSPWHQDITAYSMNSNMDIFLLLSLLKDKKLITCAEIGCGEGYLANRLNKELSFEVTGYDISNTAIDKARQLHDSIKFDVADFTSTDFANDNKYDLVFIKNVFWYVLDDLDIFMKNIQSIMKENSYIYINQSIPDLDKFYGQEIFPNTFSYIHFFDKYFNKIYASSTYEIDANSTTNIYDKSKQLRYLGKL